MVARVMNDYIVTGAAGLLGSQLTKHLENLGFSVVGVDLQTGFDLTDAKLVSEFFRDNPSRNLVNLFALNEKVNGAGFGSNFLDLDLDIFRKTVEVNLTSLFSVCREFIRSNVRGNIVNFSSIYGVRSPDARLYSEGEKPISYGVSKAGVIQLSRHLATHSAPNFRVNTLVLGGILENQNEEFVTRYSANVPLGRMGSPSEILGAVEFLTSDVSSYITGSAINIDGGWTAW